MARQTFVMRAGALVPKHLAAPLHVAHSDGPSVISDELDYVQNPADGRRYTSKSRYYAEVRARGLEIVGNEDLAKHTPRRAESTQADIVAHIKRAMEEVGSR
jgi:hypothetical protein